jgi:RNA polymerase sigma factor (sigma-70 family)
MNPPRSFVDDGVVIDTSGQPRSTHDPASFEAFYRAELRGQVQRAALLLGSSALANDVVHDAFIAVFARWGTLDEPGPYLNRCVLNRCRDLQRRMRSAPDHGAPDFVGDRSEDVAVWDALRRLPFRQRAALIMRYWEGLDERQIADALGVRPGSVGPLLSRGKSNLERRWER